MSKNKNPQKKTTPITDFRSFGLHPLLERGVRDAGFEKPRPIQAEALPAGLDGLDVLGLAQTGTGKTAAFALTLLDWILRERKRGIQALVLAPTRELATQIDAETRTLARHTKLKTAVIFGGVPKSRQIRQLRQQPEIVIGCPGRILDLMQEGYLDLGGVEGVVLDEADQMFDMGFLPGVRKILGAIPQERQNLLFSATMPAQLRKLADELLHEPHVVDLAGTAPAATIDHGLVRVAEQRKRPLLLHMLEQTRSHRAIVFTRTKHRAKRLAGQLKKAGHRATDLQGNLSQSQRDRAMGGFRDHRFDILVATDIAARGIDVSGVSHVINFDVPNTPEQYTHRIGRTGRSEATGRAYTFVTENDLSWLKATERRIGQPIRREEVAGFPDQAQTQTPAAAPAIGANRANRRNARPSQPRRRNSNKR